MSEEKLDYKDLYLKLYEATENAVDILISAQAECEELYMRKLIEERCAAYEEAQEQGEPPA